MERFPFTKQTLAQIRPAQKAVTVGDTEVPGLKLKIHPRSKRSGRRPRKTFLLEKRIKGNKGSAVTFTLGTFPNMRIDQARQKAREYANLCEQGLDPREKEKELRAKLCKRKTVTLAEVVERFFAIQRKRLAERTLSDYEKLLRTYFKGWMQRNLCTLTPDELVEKYQTDCQRSQECAKKAMKLLNQMWRWVAPLIRENGERVLKGNPVQEAKSIIGKWKQKPPLRTVIPIHKLGEFVALLEQWLKKPAISPGERSFFQALLTCLFCGLRGQESRLLKWEEVDLARDQLTISRCNAKYRIEHVVPYPDYIKALFRRIHARNSDCHPYVFPSPLHDRPRPIGPSWPLTHRISQKLGIPFSPHAARRTFASIGNYLGLPMLTLKRLINHYQGGITGGYVVQSFDPQQNRKHFQAIADFILEKRDEFLGIEKSPEHAKFEKLKAYAISVGYAPTEVINWSFLD